MFITQVTQAQTPVLQGSELGFLPQVVAAGAKRNRLGLTRNETVLVVVAFFLLIVLIVVGSLPCDEGPKEIMVKEIPRPSPSSQHANVRWWSCMRFHRPHRSHFFTFDEPRTAPVRQVTRARLTSLLLLFDKPRTAPMWQ